jgi:hypothetical protein
VKQNNNPRNFKRKWRESCLKGITQEKPCTNGLQNAQRSFEKLATGWVLFQGATKLWRTCACTKIQSLNEEVSITLDPLEQQEKFDKIQQEDNELNALFEAQSVAKKELWEF